MKSTPQALELDVRPIFAAGQPPCDAIDEAVAKLETGQDFVLLAPFQPVPLYAKLGRAGFSHEEELLPDGGWRIVFRRASAAAEPSAGPAADIELDNRGLEPPDPLVRTLEAVGKLAAHNKLIMRSDRKPLHLFNELEARGFAFDCTEQPDHSFITQIWRAQPQT